MCIRDSMSPNRMYNEYFLPYQAAIEAGAGSVMSSFNDINGIPVSYTHLDVYKRQLLNRFFIAAITMDY